MLGERLLVMSRVQVPVTNEAEDVDFVTTLDEISLP